MTAARLPLTAACRETQEVVQRGQALLQAGGDREGSSQHTELSVLVYHFLKVTWVSILNSKPAALQPMIQDNRCTGTTQIPLPDKPPCRDAIAT